MKIFRLEICLHTRVYVKYTLTNLRKLEILNLIAINAKLIHNYKWNTTLFVPNMATALLYNINIYGIHAFGYTRM